MLTRKALVIAVMHQGPSYLAALDKQTGKQLWQHEREVDAPGEARDSYTTPIVIKVAERETVLVLVLGADHVTAHDAANGKETWRVGGLNPNRRGNWRLRMFPRDKFRCAWKVASIGGATTTSRRPRRQTGRSVKGSRRRSMADWSTTERSKSSPGLTLSLPAKFGGVGEMPTGKACTSNARVRVLSALLLSWQRAIRRPIACHLEETESTSRTGPGIFPQLNNQGDASSAETAVTASREQPAAATWSTLADSHDLTIDGAKEQADWGQIHNESKQGVGQ